jgi:aminoglycoside N3'-acetyltransferase
MYFRNFILKRKIKLVQLADIIINDMNITRNDIVMVHTSLHNINMIDFQPEDLIYLLKMIVGTKGTLLMPIFAESRNKIINYELTYYDWSAFFRNDLIIELFRQMPDTIQSCGTTESFVAWGKMAKNIAEDHYQFGNGFNKDNLFYKLYLMKAKIIGIGVPLPGFSFRNAIDYKDNKDSLQRYSGISNKESIDFNVENIKGYYNHILFDTVNFKSQHKIFKHFEEGELRVFRKRGIPFFWINAEKFYSKTLLFSKSGIQRKN